MFRVCLNQLALIFAAVLGSAALLHAALPTPSDLPRHDSLAGQLLIAAPTMSDPRFYQAVILMVRHDRDGALGIVVNRPVEERSLASLLAAVGGGGVDTAAEGQVLIFAGGPVQPEIGFVLHSTDYHRPETLGIDSHVAMTSSREILRDIAKKHGPRQSLVAFGYAGWGAGQLENELERRVWFAAPNDAALVFEKDRNKVWDEAMKHRTQDL
jgi:putative transcriptional regulator